MNTQEVTGSLLHWVAKEIEMTVLSEFSLKDLEEEVTRRKADLLETKVSAIYAAIAEAEDVADSQGVSFSLALGSYVLISYDPATEDWASS